MSESEFDHGNKIPCLKVGALVYEVLMYQNVNAFYQSLTYAVVASQIASLCETDCFSVLRHARH